MQANPQYQQAEQAILQKLQEGLPGSLVYHCYQHTLDVMDAAITIANYEQIAPDDIPLLRVAVAFHDAGFLYTYENHEDKSCELMQQMLPSFGFAVEQIAIIKQMILSTKIPQQPLSVLDAIIADADLDYLGNTNVYSVAQHLFDELRLHQRVSNHKEWINIQILFLQQHQYHTSFSKKYRESAKQKYLHQLLAAMA